MSDLEDALIALGITVHGPVDMTLTAMIWPQEANPFVAHLGLTPWLGFKTGLLSAMLLVYVVHVRPELEEDNADRRMLTAMVAFVALGAAVMLMNLLALYAS